MCAARTNEGGALSPEEIAAARERAARLIANSRPEDKQGLQDLQNSFLALGLPAARRILRHMVRAAGLRGAAKASALREIAEISPITEVGCMEVTFHDRLTGKGRTAYLVVDQCPRGHNLNAQLDKIKPRIPDDKWPEIQKHLAVLIWSTRSVYTMIAGQHQALLARLAGDKLAEYRALKVDTENTTLYVDASWPNRVGLFVRLDEEVEVAPLSAGNKPGRDDPSDDSSADDDPPAQK